MIPDLVLPPMNAHARFKRGQTIWVVQKVDGLPRIVERTVKTAVSRYVTLKGGFPDDWRDDPDKAIHIDKWGMHVEGAWRYLHTTLADAQVELRQAIMQRALDEKKRFLRDLEDMVTAPVLRVAEETEYERHMRLRGQMNSLGNGKKRRQKFEEAT